MSIVKIRHGKHGTLDEILVEPDSLNNPTEGIPLLLSLHQQRRGMDPSLRTSYLCCEIYSYLGFTGIYSTAHRKDTNLDRLIPVLDHDMLHPPTRLP